MFHLVKSGHFKGQTIARYVHAQLQNKMSLRKSLKK